MGLRPLQLRDDDKAQPPPLLMTGQPSTGHLHTRMTINTQSAPQTSSLKRKLTLRYAAALFVIAVFIGGSHFFFILKIEQDKNTALVINMSGMQRMLSQRVALLAREMSAQGYIANSKDHYNQLQESLAKLQDNHKKLSSGIIDQDNAIPISKDLLQMYRGDGQIDALFDEFFFHAQRFIQASAKSNAEPGELANIADALVALALGGMLDKLDAAVSQYQREAESRTARFRQLHALVLLIALCILVVEALLIFRPMVSQIAAMTQDLEESNSELLEFSYRISHDLRAPIVSSQGLMDLAETGLKDNDPPMIIGALAHAKTSLRKLETLIEDIINLTRTKSTQALPEPVDVAELVNGAIASLSHMTQTTNLQISSDIDLSGPVLVKRLYLQQILENLISNAIKYHDPQEEQPWVRITARADHGSVVIRVEDNGLGIPEDQRERVFGMFQRFHPRASFGSGLGLYLVQKNAQQLAGTVQCIPLHKGTAFELIIPVTFALDGPHSAD